MSKIATLVGCAIGDALGNPFEMRPANSPLLQEWDGFFKAGGTFWKGNAGQYTDDTLMSIALSKSLIQCQGFDPVDVAKEYLSWYNTGNTRGIGTTTATAIENLKLGLPWDESGLTSNLSGGNGTAMRAAPLGLVYRNDPEKLMNNAMLDAMITHNNIEPKMGSIAVALGTAFLVTGWHDNKSVLFELSDIMADSIVKDKLLQAKFHIEQNTDHEAALADIGSSGYVPETVGAAFYCLAKATTFKNAVVMAVRAGGDTDSVAAIVGAMAGTYYTLDGIPDDYKNNVEDFELLTALDDELMNIEV